MLVSRRQFLKYSAVAGGALHLGIGFENPRFSGRVAIIGLGDAGVRHLNSVLSIEGFEVVAIADPVDKRRDAVLKRLRATGRRPPLEEDDGLALLKKTRADIVVIATPDCLHDEEVRLALKHGSHVMVEPLPTSSVEEWDMLVAEFRDRRRMLQVAAPWRSDPRLHTFKSRVSRRLLGGSKRASISCRMPNRERTSLLCDGGGPISDALFPALDVLGCVSGNLMPSAVFATGSALRSSRSRLEAPRTMIAVIRTHADVEISIEYAELGCSGHSGLTSTVSLASNGSGAVWQLEHRPRQVWLTSLWTRWLSTIRREAPQAEPPESFRSAIAFSHGLLRAYASGRTENFPVNQPAALSSTRLWSENILT